MGFQGEGRGFGGAPREMHKATCGECKKECEVPFKPREDRPVYCKDCFAKRKDASGRQKRLLTGDWRLETEAKATAVCFQVSGLWSEVLGVSPKDIPSV